MTLPGALVVFAKAPRAGEVKTRMCPPLQPELAAELYTHLLADVLEASAEIAGSLGLAPLLAVHPPASAGELAAGAPSPFRVVAQRGADLAQRMDWALREAQATGARRVLLRGSDSPLLGREDAAAALAALGEADVALSPDRGGGYSLVGVGRQAVGLFDHPMSTPSVLDDTLANARALGLRTRLLEPSLDLDSAADLAFLEPERSGPRARICARTLAFCDARNLWQYAGRG